MIKLSVITDEISEDFEHALDVALAHDVKHVELRSLWETNVANLSDDQIARARELLDERDMQVVAIAGPVFKCHLSEKYIGKTGDSFHAATDQGIDEHIKILEQNCMLADAFGTDIVRTFAFWRAGDPTAEIYDEIAVHLNKAVEVAEKAGKRLALENEHACFIATSQESIEILSRVTAASCGLIWDPGNAAAAFEKDAFPEGYEKLKEVIGMERIFHVHVKDPITRDGKVGFTEVGQGEIDYAGHLKALVEDGYEGALSLETHWQGEGLSKEESTSRCLKALWRIIDEAGLRSSFA